MGKKFEGKMDKLAGIVRANAVKNARGRAQLKSIMDANKKILHANVEEAVHKGEVRMMKAEQKLKDMNKKTKASLNMRITSEVSKLAKESAAQIENLRLSSKSARAEMRRELLYAVRSAAAEAKKNLVAAVRVAKVGFAAANAKKASQRSLRDAVGSMNRSLLALKTETAKKIKKTNHKATAYAGALKKEAKDVDAAMKANMAALISKINRARAGAKSSINRANAASAAGFRAAMKAVSGAMKSAQKRASSKFGKLYVHMARNRARADAMLASSVKAINDGIAKQAALADSRFSKTVKNIAAARAQAAKQVSDSRKTFATAIARTTASVKDQESRHSASIRARGKLRALLDENKRAA